MYRRNSADGHAIAASLDEHWSFGLGNEPPHSGAGHVRK